MTDVNAVTPINERPYLHDVSVEQIAASVQYLAPKVNVDYRGQRAKPVWHVR